MKDGERTSERRSRLLFASASCLASILGAFACAGSDEEPDAFVPEPPAPAPLDAGQSSDATAEDVATMAPRHGCSDDGFCYVSVPADVPLSAVSGSSADDAWMATASGGALLHFDGASIERVYEYAGAVPETVTYVGLWARQSDNVWALAHGSDGRALVVRYASPPSGGAPAFRELHTDVSSSASMSAWGTPAGDALWVVKPDGVLRIREDSAGAIVDDFTPVPADGDPSGYRWSAIWGFGPDDVYVAGKVCPSRTCAAGTRGQGALARYDGTTWSIMPVADARDVTSLRGTPPGAERQLWVHLWNEVQSPVGGTEIIYRTELAPIAADGAPGALLHSLTSAKFDLCDGSRGQATGPSTGWFSNGLLVCRWAGTQISHAATAVDGRQVVDTVNGIWADGADDVWLVGSAITRGGLPPTPFAARRTAATAAMARGETP